MTKENYSKVVSTITILLITFFINCGIIYVYFTSLKNASNSVNEVEILALNKIEIDGR